MGLRRILDKVAETFLAIKPDLPTPAQITFPLQVAKASTAFTKDLLKILFIFFSSAIWIPADFFAIFI